MNILNMSIYYCGYGKFKKKRTRRRHSPLPFSILWWSRSFGEICENLKKKKISTWYCVCLCASVCERCRQRERDCKRQKESLEFEFLWEMVTNRLVTFASNIHGFMKNTEWWPARESVLITITLCDYIKWKTLIAKLNDTFSMAKNYVQRLAFRD